MYVKLENKASIADTSLHEKNNLHNRRDLLIILFIFLHEICILLKSISRNYFW